MIFDQTCYLCVVSLAVDYWQLLYHNYFFEFVTWAQLENEANTSGIGLNWKQSCYSCVILEAAFFPLPFLDHYLATLSCLHGVSRVQPILTLSSLCLQSAQTCHICNRQFGRKDHLKRHFRMVHLGMRDSECQYCGKRFGQKSTLDEHVLRLHTQERPFPCSLCDRAFVVRKELRHHCLSKHGTALPNWI